MRVLIAVALIGGIALALPVAAGPAPPRTLDGCVRTGPGVKVIQFPAPGRLRMRGAVLGSGPRGVVLANQSKANVCSWLPFARVLARRGYRVLLFDYVSAPHRSGLDAAYAGRELVRRGARRVVYVGASKGADAALIAAGATRPRAAGAVTLSARALQRDAHGAVTRLSAVLFVAAEQDEYSADMSRLLYARTRTADKRLVVWPNGDHGMGLLWGQRGAATKQLIFAFLRTHLRA